MYNWASQFYRRSRPLNLSGESGESIKMTEERSRNIKSFLFVCLLAGLLLLLGDRLISQRQLDGPSAEMTISGDTLVYVSMIEGDFDSAPNPFKYRVLVPAIGKVIPLSPTASLKAIAYVSLFLAYLFALLACRKLGLGLLASFFGLFVLYSSTWHLYNFHNPYLTDAFQLMALSLMFYALVLKRFSVFSLGAILGVMARETTLFLVPAWVITRQWRNLGLVLVIVFAAWFLPRLALSSDSGALDSTRNLLNGIDPISRMSAFDRPVFIQWGITGLLAITGILLIPANRFWSLLLVFLGLLSGAYFSSLIAGDIGRMIELLSPAIFVSCAYLFSVLLQHNKLLALLLVLTLAFRLFWVPTYLLPRDSFVFDSVYPRVFLTLIHLALWLAVIYVLRSQFIEATKEKFDDASDAFRTITHRVWAFTSDRWLQPSN